jgi:hypothetical protein
MVEHAVISRVNDFKDLENIDLEGDFRCIAADSQIKPTYSAIPYPGYGIVIPYPSPPRGPLPARSRA